MSAAAYTPVQRAGLAKAFKAAKEFLWDGRGPARSTRLPWYICHALRYACAAGRIDSELTKAAQAIVMGRIAPSASASEYFMRQGRISRTPFIQAEAQAARLKFLDELIEEFSA